MEGKSWVFLLALSCGDSADPCVGGRLPEAWEEYRLGSEEREQWAESADATCLPQSLLRCTTPMGRSVLIWRAFDSAGASDVVWSEESGKTVAVRGYSDVANDRCRVALAGDPAVQWCLDLRDAMISRLEPPTCDGVDGGPCSNCLSIVDLVAVED